MTDNYPPLVSFIIATKNSSSRIIGLLESIKTCAPTGKYEIIVSDSQSSDNTLEVLNSYSLNLNITIASYSDTGIYSAWNKAIPCASGLWIIFLGDDDRLYSKTDTINAFHFLDSISPDVPCLVLFNAFLGNPELIKVSPTYDRNQLWKGMRFFHPSSAVPSMLFKSFQFDENFKIVLSAMT